MSWGMIPLWLKIWILAGIGSWLVAIIPFGLSFKTARWPALIFGTSVLALIVWGHLHGVTS